ncbi:MAG: AAA family ATPase [Lachnospiraceae bacterium]|nr:AAA family ATPase [Lachnospiraceae bacterium]
MDRYRNYQEFVNDIIIWGDHVCQMQDNVQPAKSLRVLLEKAAQSADHGVFSPFLYISLSAHLEWEEMMFLAAAFYMELYAKSLDFDTWTLFWNRESADFPGTELFYQPAPLLFEHDRNDAYQKSSVRISPQIFLFLKGALLETRDIPGMYWYHPAEDPLPSLGCSNSLYQRIDTCLSEVHGRKLVYLRGQKGNGRKLNYAHLAAQKDMGLAVIPYSKLQSEGQLREIRIECLLHHAMFAIELEEEGEDLSPLLHWLADEETIFLLGTQKEIFQGNAFHRQYLPFSIPAHKVLGDKKLFETLSLAYQWQHEAERTDFLCRCNFLPGRMREILELAKSYSLSDGSGSISGQHIKSAMLRVSSHSLDKYAKKIRSIYQMDDLILPDLPKQKLIHIINRVRNRKLVYEEWGFLEKSAYGNGISMIFAGPPGTGKTMAAQVMASELGMELYRVDLSAVVDKYIGETEKKLNRIFEEAEKSMAILFFDEADVLFSKRTEIKESNDKYSNMEIAFLLQKMEEHEGISILATNYLQNFDCAFRRRISDIIDFPLPDICMRKKMWQSMIPSRLPVSDEIDFDFLARQFEASGSMIKNALIYASFLAAEAQEPVLTMDKILKGLSHELEKSGKKLSRDEYGEYGHLF